MGKKSKGKTYVSKGIVGHPMKTPRRGPGERIMNQLKAWRKGKHVMLTVPGPDRAHAMIRVPAVEVWGNPKANKRKLDNERTAEE